MTGSSMNALVLHAVGDARLQEVPRPEVGHGHVAVRVGFCGVCGSDIPRVFVKGTYSFPTICGHEFAGVVEEVGPAEAGAAPLDVLNDDNEQPPEHQSGGRVEPGDAAAIDEGQGDHDWRDGDRDRDDAHVQRLFEGHGCATGGLGPTWRFPMLSTPVCDRGRSPVSGVAPP